MNLDTIKALVPWAALTFAIWFSFFLVRRYAPKLWAWPALLPLKSSLETWIELVVPLNRLSSYLPLVNLFWSVWQGLPAVLVGAMVDAVQNHVDVGHAWRGALAGALAPVLHHVMKALPVPYQGALAPLVKPAAPSKPPSKRPPSPPGDGGLPLAAALCVAIALALGQVGCAGTPMSSTDVAAVARNDARMGYSIAAVTLTAFADVHRAWVRGLDAPTPAQEKAMDDILVGLDATKAILEKAKPFLEDGKDPAGAKRTVLDALHSLSLVAELLEANGLKVPKEVGDGVEAALVALGGAS